MGMLKIGKSVILKVLGVTTSEKTEEEKKQEQKLKK